MVWVIFGPTYYQDTPLLFNFFFPLSMSIKAKSFSPPTKVHRLSPRERLRRRLQEKHSIREQEQVLRLVYKNQQPSLGNHTWIVQQANELIRLELDWLEVRLDAIVEDQELGLSTTDSDSDSDSDSISLPIFSGSVAPPGSDFV